MLEPLSVTIGWYALVAVLGLAFGSFLNVAIFRLPKRIEYQWRVDCRELLKSDPSEEPSPPGLLWPASHCPHCKHPIRPQHNIPILSYLLLRGRCADCGTHIGIRYPAVELLTAVLACVVIWRFGINPTALAALVLTFALIVLTFIDYDHQLLPDIITVPGIWLGLLVNLFGTFTTLPSAVIGALAGYISLWLMYHGFRLATGKEGMGYGDFKLLAMLGAWLGWHALPLIVILSAGVGSILGLALIATKLINRANPIPFGPFLAAAGWIALIWGYALLPRFMPYLYR